MYLRAIAIVTAAALTLTLCLAAPGAAQETDLALETYTLPNGLTVILHEDHTLPQVTINLWCGVGSKNERAGRSGFAHLFEHLMFMGTERVPGNSFDTIMEGGGGANNAGTSHDYTVYMSWGPPSLLPTLLWLDADRLDALGSSMTQEKLDLQRDVVRNELRERIENTPYGVARVLTAEALYPEGHPYHHPSIGSHEDLAAATLDDVKEFFDTYYVPGNTSLVVAGDFDPEKTRPVIAATFGAVPARPLPQPTIAEPVVLDREVRRLAVDRVQAPRLSLIWHSPAAFTEGDAEADLLTSVLVEGQSSRLYRRLVIEEPLAQEVDAFQRALELGGQLHIVVTAAAGVDLERIKQIILEEITDLRKNGPTEAELQRVKAASEAELLQSTESLVMRAVYINQYRYFYGDGNGFGRDLQRRTTATTDDLRTWARRIFTPGRLDLRILPLDASVEGADLDTRPGDFPPREFEPPLPITFNLDNGIPVYLISRPGTGLFSGALLVDGGDRLLEPDQAGLAKLSAAMLSAGAGGRSAAQYADAVTSLGAGIEAFANRHNLLVEVSGLSSRLEPTLDLFTDAVLRPNLREDDFTREQSLALDAIRSRVDRPARVAVVAGSRLMFAEDDLRGRPLSGTVASVSALTLQQLTTTLPRLLNPVNARLVLAGDLDRQALEPILNARLGSWRAEAKRAQQQAEPQTAATRTGPVLVDRPQASQTMLMLLRPLPSPADLTQRTARQTLMTLFGGTFTSRLMQSIREEHGFSYGVRSRIVQEGEQHLLMTYTSVQAEVTAAALVELKKQFDALAGGDVSAEELEMALRTQHYGLVTDSGTTDSLADGLQEIVDAGLPLDTVRQTLNALTSIDLERVNELARSGLFDWDQLLVVMVGDAEQVLPQLEETGLGTPLRADSEGTLPAD